MFIILNDLFSNFYFHNVVVSPSSLVIIFLFYRLWSCILCLHLLFSVFIGFVYVADQAEAQSAIRANHPAKSQRASVSVAFAILGVHSDIVCEQPDIGVQGGICCGKHIIICH